MSADRHSQRELLGAYVLGQLPDDQAADVEHHLLTCASCRAEHADLAPVGAALSDVRDGLRGARPHVATPPQGLGDRVVAAISDEQRRTSRSRALRGTLVAAVAGVAAAVALVVGLRITEPDTPKIPLEAVEITREDPAVDASADLVAHTWGVEVKLQASGFEAGERYVVSVLGEGRRYPAGEFVGTGTREMSCNLNSSVLRDRADGFEVRDRSGSVVLASRF